MTRLKCDDCGRKLGKREERYLVYRHKVWGNELIRRLCRGCADEEWLKARRKAR